MSPAEMRLARDRRRTWFFALAVVATGCLATAAGVRCSREVPKSQPLGDFAIELIADVHYGPAGATFPLHVKLRPELADVALTWSVSAGEVVGDGASPSWRSPQTPQAALIWVTAERGSIRRTAGIRITTFSHPTTAAIIKAAVPPAPEAAPLDLEITSSRARICRGESTVLRAHARNADPASSAEIHYLWDVTSGEDSSFMRTGPGLSFTAPANAPPGKIAVRVRATNAAGALHELELDDGPAPPALASASASIEIGDCEAVAGAGGLAIAQETRPISEARFDVYDLLAMTGDPDSKGDPYDYRDTSSVRAITRFEWDFGDGTPKLSTPVGRATHVYEQLDPTHAHHFFVVTLRMTRADGSTAEATAPVDLQLFKSSLKTCAFAHSLASSRRSADKQTTVDILFQNVSGVIANVQSLDLTLPAATDVATRTFSTATMVDTSIAPGYATTATLTVNDSDFGPDGLAFVRLRANDPSGAPCVAYMRLAAFEGEVLEFANRTPSFAEQEVPGGSPGHDTKLARWRATQQKFEVTEDQAGAVAAD